MTSPADPADPAPAVRVRFAPSPTGFLHVGGARSALFNWLFARHSGGQMLLRIEDTDTDRSKPELTQMIFDTLGWLGIDWDAEPVYQSTRGERYAAAADQLLAGGRAYRCDCIRDQIDARAKERGGKPGYDGFCRDRDVQPGNGVVVRFRATDDGVTSFDDVIRGEVAFPNADLEDFVIVRANGQAMFLLANAVDDAEMGITHVLRGEDLLNVTPKVIQLRQALGFAEDPVFAHLPLIVGPDRKKLSKRHGDTAVETYQGNGYLAEALANYLATLGWGAPDDVEIRPMAEIVELFELSNVSKSGAMFDFKKLDHFNGEYIRGLVKEDFVVRSQPWLLRDDVPWPPERFDAAVFDTIAPLVQERVKSLAEVPGYVDFLFLAAPVIDEKSWEKTMVKGRETAVVMLDAMIDRFATCDWTLGGLEDALFGFGDAQGIKRGQAQAPIRVAVTGRTVGPPLLESLELLGRDATLARVRSARARLDAV